MKESIAISKCPNSSFSNSISFGFREFKKEVNPSSVNGSTPFFIDWITEIACSLYDTFVWDLASLIPLLIILSLSFLFSNKWFYINESKVIRNTNVTYSLQITAVDKIIKDANGKSFSLKQ